MSRSNTLIARQTLGMDVLRIALCAIMITHGSYRFYEGSLPILGQIIEAQGLPFGVVLAYLVNLAETGGALLLLTRRLVLPMCLLLTGIYATGVLWFHGSAGFFVVEPGNFDGPQHSGWEYSALLMTCLLVTAWQNRARGWR
jgi:putative oxidoreductase